MNDDNSMKKERRKQARLAKLGTNNPICGVCGESDWRKLQLHHISDYKRDEATVIVCASCHRIFSDDQMDHPKFDPEADKQLDRIGHFLLGLADMLKIIMEKLYEFGRYLIERAKANNNGGPSQ